MPVKKNYVLFLCILLTKIPLLYGNQVAELDPEAHNQEFELNEAIEEHRKERKIEHPNRTKKGPDTKID